MDRPNVHNNFYYFTAALLFLLVASALVSSTPDGEHHIVVQLVMFFTQLVAYFTLSLGRHWRRFVFVMLVLMLIANILREFTTWHAAPITGLLVSLVFYTGMAIAAARQVLFTGYIESNTIVGAFAVYLLMGLIWTILYLLALELWPEGFNGIQHKDWNDNFGVMTYYSYVTMTTLGYGDISPALPVTRTLAYLQAVAGTFYMAVVVASMVGALRKTK
ncbi:MAG: potassium channel family protein [Pseudomonadota bacterium]